MCRAAFAAVCCCRCAVEIRRDAQLGVAEQHRHFDELDAGGDQEAGGASAADRESGAAGARRASEHLQHPEHVPRMERRADALPWPAARCTS